MSVANRPMLLAPLHGRIYTGPLCLVSRVEDRARRHLGDLNIAKEGVFNDDEVCSELPPRHWLSNAVVAEFPRMILLDCGHRLLSGLKGAL